MDVDDTRSPSPPPIESEKSPSLPQFEEDFIVLLETLPELWNPKDKNYTNKYKRQGGCEKLLGVFKKIKPQATVEDVRKKINSLRSNYRRELKKITLSKRSGAGVDELYTPKSKSFKLLSFLHNTEKPNYSQQDENSGEIAASHENSEETVKEPVNPAPGKFSSINEISINVHPSKNKQKPKSLLTKQNDLLDRAYDFLSQTASQQSTTSNSLALVWAEKLDKLDLRQRFFAEKAIHDILFEAGLGNLHRHSVKINEPNMNAMSPHQYNASPLYSQNSNISPTPHYSSPENSYINSPTPSDLQYSPIISSPSPTGSRSHTSTFIPSQVTAEGALAGTQSSSSTISTPTHSLTIVPQPVTPTSQLHLGVNSALSHVNSQLTASSYQEGFPSQIIIHSNTNAPTYPTIHIPDTQSDTENFPSQIIIHSNTKAPTYPTIHIPDTQSDTENYTAGSLFSRFKPT